MKMSPEWSHLMLSLLVGMYFSVGITESLSLRRETTIQNDNPLLDPSDCSESQLLVQYHTTPGVEDPAHIFEKAGYNRVMVLQKAQDRIKQSQADLDEEKEAFVKLEGNVNFIFWGTSAWDFEMSAYTQDSVFIDTFRYAEYGHEWRFVDPSTQDSSPNKEHTITLDDGANYAVMTSIFFGQYQHILIDHLGYLAYLWKKLPPTTKFILVDSQDEEDPSNGHYAERLLNVLDPQFARERVVFLSCSNNKRCNKKVEIRNGGSLTLFRPPMASRDPVLYSYAREWILTKYTPKPMSLTHKTVVFYTRGNGQRVSGRVMDYEQEQRLLQQTRHLMLRLNRPEKLVVFDGSISIQDQIDLFQSASVVIGPHGGGLANLLFTLPIGNTCQSRPKVLEFVTSRATKVLQNGLPSNSYYYLFKTIPWIEYHSILYTSESTLETTFVNEKSYHDALLSIFGAKQLS